MRHSTANLVHLPLVAICAGLFWVMSGHLASAQEIQVGDSKSSVIEKYGPPRGMISAGGYETLSYDTGEITIQDGVVVTLEMLPRGVTYTAIAQKQAVIHAEQMARVRQREETQARASAQIAPEKPVESDSASVGQGTQWAAPAEIFAVTMPPPVYVVPVRGGVRGYHHPRHRDPCSKKEAARHPVCKERAKAPCEKPDKRFIRENPFCKDRDKLLSENSTVLIR